MGVIGRLDQYASMLASEFDELSMSENLLLYSEQFNNSYWTKNNYNIVTDIVTSPEGTVTGEKIVSINANTFHDVFTTLSLSSNTYTLSVFVYPAGHNFFRLRIDDGVTSRVSVFNLSNGSVDNNVNVVSSTIVLYPSGWYRCSITVTTNINNVVFGSFPTTPVGNYSGDGSSGVYLWGAQLEIGSVATDYTPTTTTAINRILPATTNTNISSTSIFYSSGFEENTGFTNTLVANTFAPYNPVYDDFAGTLFGPGQGRYMRNNSNKNIIVYNEIDEITDFRDIVRTGLVLDLDAGMNASFNNTGTTWRDLSGNGNNGTLINGVAYSSNNGGLLSFDGTNDHITSSRTIDSTFSEFTAEIFFRSPVAGNSNTGYLLWDHSLGNAMWFGKSSTNEWYWFWNYGPSLGKSAQLSSTSYTANSWVHIAVRAYLSNTNTISETNNFAELIVNGTTYSTTHRNNNTGSLNYPSGSLYLARRGTSFGNAEIGGTVSEYANVDISAFRLYNRVLNRQEILQNYNALKHRFGL